MEADTVRAISRLAATQHGAVGADQLRRLGVTTSQIRTMGRRGWIHRAAPRVYVLAGSPPSTDRDLRVGLLCLGAEAVVSHEAAARLHRFDRCLLDAVEFTVPRQGRGVIVPFVVHTSTTLCRIDRVVVDGFACTSATRTIIDLAHAGAERVRLEAALDSAVRSGASAPSVLAQRLAELRGPGRWGARQLDELLLDSGGHTLLERRFLSVMRAAGLPRPRCQVVHRAGERTFARVDFLFEDLGVVVEVSGRTGHSSPGERGRDAQRRNELQDAGRKVYEYTWKDVTRRPAYVAATMTSRLTRPA